MAVTESPAVGRSGVHATVGSRLLAGLVAAPDRLVMLLFWTCLVVSATVLAGQFRPVVVLPSLALVVAATWRLVPHAVATTRSSALGTLGALVFAAAWVVVNAPFASRYVVVTRDAGFLTLEGIWLSTHASPVLPLGRASEILGAVPGLTAAAGGYYQNGDVLHVQGAKLVPGLLGLVGWLGGTRLLLATNLVLGAIGLVAVYGLARRLVTPAWALVPVVALGLSLPMIVFSRAAYSEPVTIGLILGGVTMSWSAFETRSSWRHLLAGGLVGAAALARIDGASSSIGIIASVGLAAAVALPPRSRSRTRVALVATTLGTFAMVALGYADLRLHSTQYLADLGDQFRPLVAALVAVTGVFLVLARSPWLDAARSWLVRRRAVVGAAVCWATVAFAVLLISRPLWYVSNRLELGSSYANLIAALQRREGLPEEPMRSYDEMTVTWLSWYLGWVAVALAFAGIALLAYRAVRDRDPRRLVLLGVIAAPSALYLLQVSITPDQIWAMRRLLPVTMVGFLITAAVAVYAAWATRRIWLRCLAVLAAVVVALFPLTTWSPALRGIEHGGRLGEAQAVCVAVGDGPVIYVRAGGPNYLPTIRSLCGVDVVQSESGMDAQQLLAVREVWGDEVSVVTFVDEAVPWTGGQVPTPLLTTRVTQWAIELTHPPRTVVTTSSSVFVGHIEPDGMVTALPPVQPGPRG